MSDPIIVFASFKPKDGAVPGFLAVMGPMIEATRLEPGNEVYDLYVEDRSFHLFERYTDADALQAHRESDHYAAYRRGVADLLDEAIGVRILTQHNVAS